MFSGTEEIFTDILASKEECKSADGVVGQPVESFKENAELLNTLDNSLH